MLIRLLSALLLAAAALFTPFGFAADEPLDPKQAFKFSARALDAKTVEARWEIAKGYFLYRDKFKFEIGPETAKLGAFELPAGKQKDDELFGRVQVFYGELRVALPVEATGNVTLKVGFQGCWDKGVCYPPMTEEVKLVLPQASSAPSAGAPPSAAVEGDESSRIAGLLENASFWVVLASFFGFGLLLSLTPCVFPMIPILSGIIVNHGHAVTHGRAFLLSLAYVLGMAVTYAAVGVAAGQSGVLLSNALQNAWVLGGFALVFVVLSLSMFGFYEMQLPAALQSRLSETANRRGGSFGAIALMGALSALIVGPCVAAPLAGALLYIAQTGNAALGGAALFVMALGMGAPLLAVGLFSRSLLPKAGRWMDTVKKFFGVVMLATALWMVSPVIPVWLQMIAWAGLMIVPAIYMHALDPLPVHAQGWQKFWKGVGILLLAGGLAMLIGVLGGSRDPLQPLGFLKGAPAQGASAPGAAPVFERLLSADELDERLKSTQKPVLLDFYADWCVSCKEMERFTFADPRVAEKLKEFTLLKADVTAGSDEDKALLKRFGLFGPPGIIFFDKTGKERTGLRVVGYMGPEPFLVILNTATR